MPAGMTPHAGGRTGVIRFAHDHTLRYDNRVILEVEKGAFAWKRSLRTDSLQ
jgi:branched-chain amino acid transport system substrate-binding protein